MAKTTQEKIAVMQAHSEGKIIQLSGETEWMDWTGRDEPHWDWYTTDYRIKPSEPLKLWALIDKDGKLLKGWNFYSEDKARRALHDSHTSAVNIASFTQDMGEVK